MGTRLRSGLAGVVLLSLVAGCASRTVESGRSSGAAVTPAGASTPPSADAGPGVPGSGVANTAATAVPDASLLGTTWFFRARTVNGVGTVQPADPDAWVRFEPGALTFHRTVERSAAPQDLVCPTWTARVALTGDQVRLVDPGSDPSSREGCGTRFLGYGSGAAQVSVSGRQLTVRTADSGNRQTLVFSADRPEPPAVGTPDLRLLPPASTPTVRQEIEANPLRGRNFRAVSGPGYRAVGDGVTLGFGNDTVGVGTGCNGITAEYRVSRPGTVVFGSGTSTAMGCAADLTAQESWASSVVSGTRGFTFDGTTLRLAVPRGEAVFRVTGSPAAAPDDGGLVLGAVDEIVDATGHRRLPRLEQGEFLADTVTIAVRAGRLTFDAGCGQQVADLTGTLPQVSASTADGQVLADCPPLRSQLQTALRSILSGPLTVQRDAAGFVTITGRDGLQVTAHSGFIPG